MSKGDVGFGRQCSAPSCLVTFTLREAEEMHCALGCGGAKQLAGGHKELDVEQLGACLKGWRPALSWTVSDGSAMKEVG